jgi:hypothetical protein
MTSAKNYLITQRRQGAKIKAIDNHQLRPDSPEYNEGSGLRLCVQFILNDF